MRMIGTEAAAKLLGVTPRSIRRWIKEGKIKGTLQADRGVTRWHVDEAAVKKLHKEETLREQAEVAAAAQETLLVHSPGDTERRPTVRVDETEHGRLYVFQAGDTRVTVTEPDLKRMKRLYSNWGGQPANIDQLCAEFRLTRKEFNIIKAARSWTHTSEPFTEEEMVERPIEELEEEALASVRNKLQRRFSSSKQRDTEKAAANWWHFEKKAEEIIQSLCEGGFSFEAPPKNRQETTEGALLAVVFPTDLHYGKYGSAALGPGGGDRNTTLRRLFDATVELLDTVTNAGVENILLYVGSDGVNADTSLGTTTKGTPQSNDGEMAEIAPAALQMWFDLVELIRSYDVNVTIRTRPGNHDDLLTRVYGKALELAYRNCDDVTVDSSAREYGFFQWGACVIMDTHGDGLNATRDLAQVMSTHRPDLWGSCPFRYALRGNLHHVKDEEGGGIRNILLPSLSIEDAYHQKRWPILARPLMRMPVFSSDRGLVAVFESGPLWNAEANEWG